MREREMGIWDCISWASDSLKRNTPDLTSVKGLCQSSYNYGWDAAAKIDNAVRVNCAERLNLYWSDQDTRNKVGRVAANFAQNTAVYVCQEGLKTIPGGLPVYNILSQSLHDGKKPKGHQEMEALRAKVDRLEKELNGFRSSLLQADIGKSDGELRSENALVSNQKPEDMIKNFMMMEFMGLDLQRNLMVPLVKSGSKSR